MSTQTVVEVPSFENVHLSDVDPTFKPLDEDYYNLSIVRAEKRTFTYGATKRSGEPQPLAGQEGEFLNITLMVHDDEKYTGRRLFEAIFPGNQAFLVGMRKLADESGIQQEAGQSFQEWLQTVINAQPVVKFQAKVTKFDDENFRDENGNPTPRNRVGWFTVQSPKGE